MLFKYSAISDTVRRLRYSIIETPQIVLEAIKSEGHTDYYTIIKILKEINFDRYLSIYMLLIPRGLSYRESSDNPTSMSDLQEVLEKQLNFLESIEKSVDIQRSIYRVSTPYITYEETEGLGETDKVY